MAGGDLTFKQKKFVKAYVKTDGNGQEAAKIAYDVATDEAARAISSQNLTKLNVREAIETALIKHEITIDAAIRPIADGLVAYKTQITSDGEPIETADHTTRLKASSMALKLLGAENEKSTGNTINFNFNTKKYIDAQD